MMIKPNNFFNFVKSLLFSLVVLGFFSRCADDQIVTEQAEQLEDPATSAMSTSTCGCTYTVPATKQTIDGKALNIKPGSVICLTAGVKYRNILFKNIIGTAAAPITIKNCGGTANLVATGLSYAMKMYNSKFFKITGGSVSKSYGIKITSGHIGLQVDYLSTNFEIDHVEILNSGFAGVMAKTDPSCDNATIRANFTMRDVSIHDNYVHDVGGEGFYVGNSMWEKGMNTACGVRLPHEIHNVKIFNNIVRNSGWEGVQLGSAPVGAQVFGNIIENYGLANKSGQNNGMQIGAGTGGTCYNNFIKNGKGNGLIMMGLGNNISHNNVIVNAGAHGVFCDERGSTGPGFQFINNTIINPRLDGIRLYSEKLPANVVINNIIVNPGSYSTYSYPRTGNDAYVYKISKTMGVTVANNYFTRSITAPKFVNAGAFNYRLASGSPAVNKGKSISAYNIAKDYYQVARLKGSAYDIGASEY
jgi:hypothetical protein